MSFENQNAPNPENLSLDQLSPELMEKTSEALAYPVIALCPDGQQIGSGVLVEVDEWGVRHSANLLNLAHADKRTLAITIKDGNLMMRNLGDFRDREQGD
jgi:hypothetical protein